VSEPSHEAEARYPLAWMELRKRQWQRTAALASIFLVPVLARVVPGSGVLAMIAWIALFVFARHRVRMWPCPRCGRPFCVGRLPHPFAQSCVHCALPKGSVDPDAGGRLRDGR
jgi:hypothetical protein